MKIENLVLKKNIRRPFGLTDDEYYSLKDVLAAHHSDLQVGNEDNQCSSTIVQRIHAPASAVWSVIRRFDKPETYKPFVRSCSVKGNVEIGSVREVKVATGLPARNSVERVEILDEEKHILSFRVLAGEHRLRNYRSVTTLNEFVENGRAWTIVVESYVSDIPEGNSREDTCAFIDTIVRSNLQSLASLISQPTSARKWSGIPVPATQHNNDPLSINQLPL